MKSSKAYTKKFVEIRAGKNWSTKFSKYFLVVENPRIFFENVEIIFFVWKPIFTTLVEGGGHTYRLTKTEPKPVMRGGSDILNMVTLMQTSPLKELIFYFFFHFQSFNLKIKFS